jgi:hypothetical protein
MNKSVPRDKTRSTKRAQALARSLDEYRNKEGHAKCKSITMITLPIYTISMSL